MPTSKETKAAYDREYRANLRKRNKFPQEAEHAC